jgi:hypothetical protein
MDHVPDTKDLNKTTADEFRILFSGVEWNRKGGEIALEIFRMLKKSKRKSYRHFI